MSNRANFQTRNNNQPHQIRMPNSQNNAHLYQQLLQNQGQMLVIWDYDFAKGYIFAFMVLDHASDMNIY